MSSGYIYLADVVAEAMTQSKVEEWASTLDTVAWQHGWLDNIGDLS